MGKIAEITVPAGGQATIDFTAIPQTYKHLVVTLTARTDGAYADTDIYLTFNGDTGANYDDQYLYSTGTTSGNTSALAAAHMRAGLTAGANAPAGVYAETTIEVLNYANSTPRKNVSVRTFDHGSDTGAGYMIEEAGQWRNTAAVTRLTLTPAAGNFVAGTVATLFGVDSQVAGVAGTPYQTTKVQLDYAASTDVASALALSANAWTDIGVNQSFTVDDAASIIEIDAGGMIYLTGVSSGTYAAARLAIDSAGTPLYKQIGGTATNTNLATNPLEGGATVTLSGLAAGAHTVKLQIAAGTAATVYCRAATNAQYESLTIRVIERKVTLPAALIPGAGVLSTKTVSYTLTTSDLIIIANAASLTMTLPSAATVGAGRAYTIKNGASGTGTTVATTGAQTIDGATTQTIAAAYGVLSVVSDGANWAITAKV